MRKTKILTMSLAAVLATAWGAPVALAWGPEDRPTYTMNAPADHAVFNSITDNQAIGDERDFVKVGEKKEGVIAGNNIEIEAGKQYEVYIYYHNNASATYNVLPSGEYGPGIAYQTTVSTNFPDKLEAGQRGEISATISAMNADPQKVWDEAYITAKEAVTLHYITGSAKIYNGFRANGSTLSMNIFSEQGTLIGLNELNGIILGCDNFSGQIVYTIETEAVEVPDAPEPEEPEEPDPVEPEPEEPTPSEPEAKPEVPKELPNTGPAEIILAIVIAVVIVAGGVYWYRAHKTVKKATRKARGRK